MTSEIYKSSNKKVTIIQKLRKCEFLQKMQFCQFFILLQEGSNAQQKAYLYQRTLN